MSEFMDRARAEADRRDVIDTDWYAREAGLLFADGAQWATEQEPTDQECAALVESLDWAIRGTTDGDKIDPCSEIPVVEVMRLIEEGAQSALRAAQKVRAGQ